VVPAGDLLQFGRVEEERVDRPLHGGE
jgi:hypothetical protein